MYCFPEAAHQKNKQVNTNRASKMSVDLLTVGSKVHSFLHLHYNPLVYHSIHIQSCHPANLAGKRWQISTDFTSSHHNACTSENSDRRTWIHHSQLQGEKWRKRAAKTSIISAWSSSRLSRGSCQDSSEHNKAVGSPTHTLTQKPSSTLTSPQTGGNIPSASLHATHSNGRTHTRIHRQALQRGVEERTCILYKTYSCYFVSVCSSPAVCSCSTQSSAVWSMIYHHTDTFPVPSIKFFPFSYNCLSNFVLQRAWRLYQVTEGESQGTHWTGHHFITGLHTQTLQPLMNLI